MLTDAGAADVPLHGLTPLRVTNSKQTVQMDAAQLAKLSMLVCFYMTSMDAMSIERATIVHELQNPEIPLYHMSDHDLQRHFLREDQLLQDMRYVCPSSWVG